MPNIGYESSGARLFGKELVRNEHERDKGSPCVAIKVNIIK
jgi:hypothetical protein